jgi:hypothetical protein
MRRGWLESWPKRTGNALLVVFLILGWCREARVWCVPCTLERGVSLCLEESHLIEKVVGMLGLGMVSLLDVPFLVANMSFRSLRSYGPRSHLRSTRSSPRGRVGVPPRRDRMDFSNPTFDSFEQMPRSGSFAHSRSRFLFL